MDEENKKKEVEYIRSQKEKGVKDEAIRKALLGAGWSEDDISIGFAEVDKEDSTEAPEKIEEPEKETSSDPNSVSDPQYTSSQQPSDEVLSSTKTTENPETSDQSDRLEQNVSDSSDKKETKTERSPDTTSEDLSVDPTQESSDVTETDSKDLSAGISDKGDMSQKSDKTSVVKYILAAVVILLVIGVASVTAYFTLGMRSGSLGDMSKEEVITEAVLSYMRSDSFKNDTNIDLSMGEVFQLNASLNGYYESTESASGTKASLDFAGEVNFNEGGMTIELVSEGEARVVDGVVYAQITKVPEIPFSQEDYSAIEGEWVHFDPKDEMSESDEKQLKEALKKENEVIEMIETYGVEVLEMAQEEGFLKISSLVEDGDHIYELDLDLEKAPSFFRKIAEMEPWKEHSETLNEVADEMEKDWEKFKEDVDMEDDGHIIPLKISVDGDTGHLKEFLMNFSLDIKANEELGFFGIEEDLKLDIFFSSEFSDMGETMKVKSPDNSRSFGEIIKNIDGGGNIPMSASETQDFSIWLDFGQIKNHAQLYSSDHDGNFEGLCTNSDEGVKKIIESVEGISNEVGCEDGSDHWIAWAESTDGEGYWCSDSTGFINIVGSTPKESTECPEDVVKDLGTLYSLEMIEVFEELLNGAEAVNKKEVNIIQEMMRAGAGWFRGED